MDQHDDERDDEHEDEREDERDEDEDDGEPEPAPPPRRAAPRMRASASPSLPLSPFGAIPARATHFALRKAGPAGRWDVCEAPSPDGSIMLREWPLSELHADRIRAQFGPGDYRLQWIGTSPGGGRAAVGKSRDFGIPPAPAAPPPAASPGVASSLPQSLQDAFALMGMLEQQSNAKLATMVQLSQLASAGQRGGLDADVIRMIVESNQKQTESLVGAFTEGLRSLERRIDSLTADEGDDEPARPAPTVGAPAPLFKPGEPISESIKATALNWAASNPDQAAALAKQVLETVGKVAAAVGGGGAPRARAASAAVVRREPATLPAPSSPPAVDATANGVTSASANEAYAAAASRAPQAPASS
jgi:hypothetical protein